MTATEDEAESVEGRRGPLSTIVLHDSSGTVSPLSLSSDKRTQGQKKEEGFSPGEGMKIKGVRPWEELLRFALDQRGEAL